jgi:AcrR family transcriptional regulator
VADNSPKQQLLEKAIEYVAAHGIGELSLRSLATALGTSHRMLIFHFCSKEQLWVEIVRTVEQRQRERLRELLPDAGQPIGEALRTWWRAHLGPVAVAERAVVLRALRTGPAATRAH